LRLAEQARQVLAQYELAVREHSEAPPRGLLRMTAPVVFGRRHMAPVVTKFLTRYPDIQIDLNLTDRNQDLIENGIDLALRIGALDSSGLVARKVGMVRGFTVASPQYLERCGEPLTLEELARHELILNTGIRGLAQWRYRTGDSEHVVRFAPRLQLNDVDAILDAARAGFGIARALSYQVAPDLQAGTLQRVLRDFEQEPLPVHLVLPSARHMTARLRVFVDFAVQEFAQLKLIC
jgi:DNA-binding transcriptional LysR family regulator